ncbi:MAG: hypothetical protein VW445_07780 [Rhodospirillaceae bacterium]
MDIKTFTSSNTEDALEKVARELGEDAYILKTEKIGGLVTVTASMTPPPVKTEQKDNLKTTPETAPIPITRGNLREIIDAPTLLPTLVCGLPGSGKTSFLHKFLMDRHDRNIHYIRNGQNHLLANQNSALVASLLECDFSYRHAKENILSGESVPIIECDQIDIEKTGTLPYQAMINKFGSINICYIVESFETIQTDFLQSFANTNSNFFLIYNKKHPHLERFLRDDFVELISAVYCRLEEKNTLITKSEEIRAQLSKTYSGQP